MSERLKGTAKFLTSEQVKAMIESCDNPRDQVLIRLLCRRGMRLSEAHRYLEEHKGEVVE